MRSGHVMQKKEQILENLIHMLQDEITQILCMRIICLSDLPLLCGYYVGMVK